MTFACVAGVGLGVILITSAILNTSISDTLKGITGKTPLKEAKPKGLENIADVYIPPTSTAPVMQAPSAINAGGTF